MHGHHAARGRVAARRTHGHRRRRRAPAPRGASPRAPRRRSRTCAAAPTRGSRSARSTAAAGRRSRALAEVRDDQASVAEAVGRYAERYRQPRENPDRVAMRIEHHDRHRQRLRGPHLEAALPPRHPPGRGPGERRAGRPLPDHRARRRASCGSSTARPATFEDRASQTVVDRAFPPDRLRGHRDRRPARDPHRRGCSWSTTRARSRTARACRCRPRAASTPTTACGATGSPTPEPRRHRAHPRRRRRRDAAGARRAGAATASPWSTTPRTVLLTDDGWIAPRRPGNLDLYVFAYGRDYRAALRALYRLTGPHAAAAALRPRQLVEPLPPLHRRRVPRADGPVPAERRPAVGRGASTWTGTWSTSTRSTAAAGPATPGTPTCSPTRRRSSPRCTSAGSPSRSTCTRPRACTRTRRAYAGDREADGHRPATASCRSASTRPTRTSCEAYLEELHHPLEDEGVDFWWLDWQQGGVTRIPGLDPLWLLNHFHFLDSGRARASGR